MRIKTTITGGDKLIKSFKAFGTEGMRVLDSDLSDNADEMERKAKGYAPVDMGDLRQGIIATKNSELSYSVISKAKYSAYQEFGTGGLVNVPPDWADMAMRFKGRGIKEVNVPPHPFMYPSFIEIRKQLPKDIKNSLKRLIAKFNR